MSSSRNLRSVSHFGTAVLDIPHLAMLNRVGPERVVKQFKEQWGVPLWAVSLPVAVPDGTTLLIEGLEEHLSPTSSSVLDNGNNSYDFRALVSAFCGQGVGVYLTLDPSARFLNMPPLQLVDSQRTTSRQVCIARPRSAKLLGDILGTCLETAREAAQVGPGGILGIGVDACNLWPMGAEKGLIEATCFCPDCKRLGGDAFEVARRDSLAFNLALKESGTGISYIEDIDLDCSPEVLVELSRARGYLERDETSTKTWVSRAEALLAYLRKRHEITVLALESIFEHASEGVDPAVSRFLITENSEYDWTSGLALKWLDNVSRAPAGVDEVWIDPSGTGVGKLDRLRTRAYLWRRARYYIDEFFGLAATLSDPGARATTGASRLNAELGTQLLKARLSQALGSGLSQPSQLVALEEPSDEPGGRVGFVAVQMTQDNGNQLLNRISIAPGSRENELRSN